MGLRGPGPQKTRLGPSPYPEGNCGRADPSTQQVQARSWTPGLEGAYLAYGYSLAILGITYSSSGGAPQRLEPDKVGRVYPKPPRCSPFGDANGVRLPRAA